MDVGLTGGQGAAISQAAALVPDAPMGAVVADKGYEANAFIARVSARGAAALMPPRHHRQPPREYERPLYQERHLIEWCFGKIKPYRRLFSRVEKTARHSRGFLRFVAALVWLR